MLESSVETAFVRAAETRGVWAIKLLGLAGLPDRLCLAPRGRAAFVELKRPGEKPRPLQLWVHRKLRRLGFLVAVIDQSKDAAAFFDDWLGHA